MLDAENKDWSTLLPPGMRLSTTGARVGPGGDDTFHPTQFNTSVPCKPHRLQHRAGIAFPSFPRPRSTLLWLHPGSKDNLSGMKPAWRRSGPRGAGGRMHITSCLLLSFYPSHNLYTVFYRSCFPCKWGLFKTGGVCVSVFSGGSPLLQRLLRAIGSVSICLY